MDIDIINIKNSIVLKIDNVFVLENFNDNDRINGVITSIPNASPVHHAKKIRIIAVGFEKMNNINVPINVLKKVLAIQEKIKKPAVSFIFVKEMDFAINFFIKKAPAKASREFTVKNKILI